LQFIRDFDNYNSFLFLKDHMSSRLFQVCYILHLKFEQNKFFFSVILLI